MAIDFQRVQSLLKEGVRATLEMLRNEHPDETFYAFALYDAEGTCPAPAANSEEKWRASMEKKGLTNSEKRFYYRWGSAEWAYEGVSAGPFDEIGEILSAETPDDWLGFQARSFGACIFALKELADEGLFGSGDSRIFAFFTLSDSDYVPWLEWESARRINPPEALAAFEPQWRVAVRQAWGDDETDGGELAEVFTRIFGPG